MKTIMLLILSLFSATLLAQNGFELTTNHGGVDGSITQKVTLMNEDSDDPYEEEKVIKLRVDYTKWTPKKPNGTVIIYNHGLQSHRRWFASSANKLQESGITVYAYDRISSGTSEDGATIDTFGNMKRKRGHIDSYETFLDTIQIFVKLARQENPNSNIVLWGNSFGAKLVTAYILKYGSEGISSLIFSTPGLYSKMPLPFRTYQFFKASEDALFDIPIYETNGDNGASLFTSIPTWFEKIKTDALSLRKISKRYYMETKSMDKFIQAKSPNSMLGAIPRLYLLVVNDPMMDNEKMVEHINLNVNFTTIVKFYDGGADHRHFLPFTTDRDAMFSDVLDFIDNQ